MLVVSLHHCQGYIGVREGKGEREGGKERERGRGGRKGRERGRREGGRWGRGREGGREHSTERTVTLETCIHTLYDMTDL